MNPPGLSIPSIPALRDVLWNRVREVSAEDFHRSAVIFAPHQDDETLACGGTILKKRQAGADVGVVFMCDGSTSHAKLMDSGELSALRTEEARAALQVLEVGEADVRFLDFEERKLRYHHDEAAERVAAILNERQPEEIFVPYRADVNSDHQATYRAVLDALGRYERAVSVYEFPIWFWHRWPWVRLSLGASRTSAKAVRDALAAGLGLQHLSLFRTGIYIGDVLEEKREALDAHKSQMVRLDGTPDWPVLSDVAGGDFLANFFGPYEVFLRQDLPPRLVRSASAR